MRKSIIFCLTLLSAMAIYGATEKEAARKPKVLLVYEKTRFKTELIDEMKKQLQKSGSEVVVKEHSPKGLDAKAADYDAVFITNSGVNSKVRPWIVKWIAKNKEQKDRIVLHTTQTSNWKVVADVDSVTSASSRSEIKKLASEYLAKIKKILNK